MAERSSSPARVPWDPTQGDGRQPDGRPHPVVSESMRVMPWHLVTRPEERPLGVCSRSAACTSWGLAFGPEIQITNSCFIADQARISTNFSCGGGFCSIKEHFVIFLLDQNVPTFAAQIHHLQLSSRNPMSQCEVVIWKQLKKYEQDWSWQKYKLHNLQRTNRAHFIWF